LTLTTQTLDDALSRHGITHCRVLAQEDIVYTAGRQDEPLPIHSIRKSIISALFGQLIGDGSVRLDNTLAELGIDDSPQLTPIEKSATLEDVLTSSSGVYLPLEFETSYDVFNNMPTPWPDRESSLPGARFHYSNWNFNVLGDIYQRACGTALFTAVDRLLAQPLGFRDWDPLAHGRLHYGSDLLGATPRYPNYAIALSPRDLAQFGQLYCAGGRWECQQIIPAEWVSRSTGPVVATGLPDPFGHYGYLWWARDDKAKSPLPSGSFSALGLGGQILAVVPSHGLVIVALCDNKNGGNAQMAIPDAVVSAILNLDGLGVPRRDVARDTVNVPKTRVSSSPEVRRAPAFDRRRGRR
jgi:CubicO group peptidase (beta-lactamase class C family)